MSVRFGDLYEEMLALEEAIDRMRIDIENADCDDAAKCILQIELEMLEQKLYTLERTEIDFAKLNFISIVESIETCMHCVEFSTDFTDLAPAPIAVASTCGSRGIRLNLDSIEKIIVYEGTAKEGADKHTFVKSAMPYEIFTRAKERYVVTYDTLRDGLSIKGFNIEPGLSVTNFGNICRVDVVLNDAAKAKYGKETVTACKVLLTTRTPMFSAAPLTHAVDGSTKTYPRVATTNKTEVELVFQFYV